MPRERTPKPLATQGGTPARPHGPATAGGRAKRRPRPGLNASLVVDAARALADRQGLSSLTLRDIAAHFGVKPPSLYNHVASIEAVKRSLALEGTRLLARGFARATAGISGDAAVRALAKAYRQFARAHPGLYEAALAAPASDDVEAQAAAKDASEIVFAVLANYGLSDRALIHATRTLRSALHGFVSLENAGGFGLPVDLEQSYAQLVELLIDGLHAGRASGPQAPGPDCVSSTGQASQTSASEYARPDESQSKIR